MKLLFFSFITFMLIVFTSCESEPQKQITEEEFKNYVWEVFSEYDSNTINIVRYLINEEKHYLVYPDITSEQPMKLNIYKIGEEIILLNSITFNDFDCNKLLSIELRDLFGNSDMELIVEPWSDMGQSYSRIDLEIYNNPLTKDIKKCFQITTSEFSSGVSANGDPESDIINDLNYEFKKNNNEFSILLDGTLDRIENQKVEYIWLEKEKEFIINK